MATGFQDNITLSIEYRTPTGEYVSNATYTIGEDNWPEGVGDSLIYNGRTLSKWMVLNASGERKLFDSTQKISSYDNTVGNNKICGFIFYPTSIEGGSLDWNGVKYLWSQLSLEDYPNNETLIAILNAIDETKADKSDITALQKALESKANSGHNHYAQAITQGTLSVDRLPTIPTSKLPMDDIYNELISRLPVAEEASF